jgi:hypothetical protein
MFMVARCLTLFLALYCNCYGVVLQQPEKSTLNSGNGIVIDSVRMLWNDRMTKKSWLHINNSTNDISSIKTAGTLEEADMVGNPPNVWPYRYQVTDGTKKLQVQAKNLSAPSTTWVSYNYNDSQYKQDPGFDNQVSQGPKNSPFIFRFVNNSKREGLQLHEVGFVFSHWFNSWHDSTGYWSFRKQYKLSEFKNIVPFFKIRIDNYSESNLESEIKGSYITTDFRIVYHDKENKRVRGDVLGLVFYITPGLDFNGNMDDEIVWKDYDTQLNGVGSHRILLSAQKLGLPFFTSADIDECSEYKIITFDVLDLINKYLPPEEGVTLDNATVDGFEIYSASRSCNITFEITDIRLTGVPQHK